MRFEVGPDGAMRPASDPYPPVSPAGPVNRSGGRTAPSQRSTTMRAVGLLAAALATIDAVCLLALQRPAIKAIVEQQGDLHTARTDRLDLFGGLACLLAIALWAGSWIPDLTRRSRFGRTSLADWCGLALVAVGLATALVALMMLASANFGGSSARLGRLVAAYTIAGVGVGAFAVGLWLTWFAGESRAALAGVVPNSPALGYGQPAEPPRASAAWQQQQGGWRSPAQPPAQTPGWHQDAAWPPPAAPDRFPGTQNRELSNHGGAAGGPHAGDHRNGDEHGRDGDTWHDG